MRQLSLRVVPAHPLPLSLITVADRRLQPTLSSQIFETKLKINVRLLRCVRPTDGFSGPLHVTNALPLASEAKLEYQL